MRTWASCPVETRCGGCGNRIKVGHPMQTVHPHPDRQIKARIVRCRLCAEGEAPEDLPPPVPRPDARLKPSVLVPSGPGLLPLDFKAAREPGAEG